MKQTKDLFEGDVLGSGNLVSIKSVWDVLIFDRVKYSQCCCYVCISLKSILKFLPRFTV